MKVKDLMSKNIISVSSEDFVITALSKMHKNNLHQLVVMDGKNFTGMLELKKIVTKNIDPAKTKVNKFITSSSSISQNESMENAVKYLLDAGVRAMPVIEKGVVIGIVSEADLIKHVESKKLASDIATSCEFVSLEDSMGHVAEIMRDKNISRVPVVENGKLIGIVGTMDMARLLEGKERIRDRQGSTIEKTTVESTKVKTLMSNPYIADSNTPLEKLKDTLLKSEEIFIQDEGLIKIITPKDVLELFVQKPKRGAYVQITNLEDESVSVKSKIDKITDEFVKKTSDMTNDIEYLFIHIDRDRKQGKKIKYSVRTRFSTNIGLFVSHADGWDIISVMQDALNNLDREISKKHE